LTRAKASGGNVSPPAQSGEGTAAESIGSPQSTQAKASGDNYSKVKAGDLSASARANTWDTQTEVGKDEDCVRYEKGGILRPLTTARREWKCNNKAMYQELQQSQDLQTFHHRQRLTLVRKVHDKGSVYIAQTAFSLLCV